MKKLLLALALVASIAQAETITLAPTPGFGALKEFFNIPNDAGLTVTIYSNIAYPTQYLYLDGVMYSGPNQGISVMSDGIGHSLTLTTTYTSHTTCGGSGHQGCHTVWVLQGNSIVR
jgi:hypothetical protein